MQAHTAWSPDGFPSHTAQYSIQPASVSPYLTKTTIQDVSQMSIGKKFPDKTGYRGLDLMLKIVKYLHDSDTPEGKISKKSLSNRPLFRPLRLFPRPTPILHPDRGTTHRESDYTKSAKYKNDSSLYELRTIYSPARCAQTTSSRDVRQRS